MSKEIELGDSRFKTPYPIPIQRTLADELGHAEKILAAANKSPQILQRLGAQVDPERIRKGIESAQKEVEKIKEELAKRPRYHIF